MCLLPFLLKVRFTIPYRLLKMIIFTFFKDSLEAFDAWFQHYHRNAPVSMTYY